MLFCSIEVAGVKPPQRSLRDAKGLTGLPSLAFLDAAGAVLVQVPFDQRTVDGVRRALARAREFLRLRAEAPRDALAAAGFLRMQLEERQLGLEAARAQRRALPATLDRELLAALDLQLLDLEVTDAVHAAGQQGRRELGPRFLRMLREGPHPSPRVSRGYWYAMLEWAEQQKDADAFAAALDDFAAKLRVTDPDAAWVEPMLERYRATLKQLRVRR